MDYSILNELLTPTRIIIMVLGFIPMVIGFIMYASEDPETKDSGNMTAMLGSVFGAIVAMIVCSVFAMTHIFNQ